MRLTSAFVRALATAGIVAGMGAAGMAAASAAPSNAPTSLTGSFRGCSNGDSGTFVVNSGKTHAPVTWDSAHLTFTDGSKGIFVSTMTDLSVNGMAQGPQTKGSAVGSVTCSIVATQPGFMLTGTVTGNIVLNG
jgi:hypothetical protein